MIRLLLLLCVCVGAYAQVPPTNAVPCTNCLSLNGLTNDPMLHFDAARRVAFSSQFYLNTWQWYVSPNTNALHVYDAVGNYLPERDEANGTLHHDIYGLWNQSPSASGITLAVVDSGQHGRWCASVAGSPSGDGTNMAGIARDVNLRRYETVAYGSEEVAAQINRAVADGASVISMSFGYVTLAKPTNVIAAMRAASNVVFTLAALNGVGPEDNSIDWLCLEQLPNALCVTAIAKGGELLGAYGTNIAVAAAGRRVPADDEAYGVFISPPAAFREETVFGEPRTLASVSGTSLAAPLVAGVCAHLRALYPSETAAQICQRIRDGSEPVGTAWSTHGVRNLNAGRSALWARSPKLGIDSQFVYASIPVGVTGCLQASLDLTSWASVATNLTGDSFPHPVLSNQTAGFYRLRVTQ